MQYTIVCKYTCKLTYYCNLLILLNVGIRKGAINLSKTLTISIGTFSIKARSTRAHETGQEDIYIQIDWRALREFGTAAKIYTLARFRHLLNKYDQHLKEKKNKYLGTFPPHSIFCEKRCCNKAFSSYHRFLKKELQWDKDGHIMN